MSASIISLDYSWNVIVFMTPLGLLISLAALVLYLSVKEKVPDLKRRIAFLLLLVALFSLSPIILVVFDLFPALNWYWLYAVLLGTLDIRTQVKRLEIINNDREESMSEAESTSREDITTVSGGESTLRTGVSIVLFFLALVVFSWSIVFGSLFGAVTILYILFFSYLGSLYANACQQIDRMGSTAQQPAV